MNYELYYMPPLLLPAASPSSLCIVELQAEYVRI